MPLSPGEKLGPYEILEPIGRGGMGDVYRAHDARLGRDVAIKVSQQQFSERFDREARAVAALNHPNVCTLFDVGPNYLVMELIDGPTLAERIHEGAIPVEESLNIARQIADALDAAHDKGITHRDLKPGNVKLRPDGTVKVLDFGLAKVGPRTASGGEHNPDESPTISMAATQAGVILGTAAYMAPEQARGKNVDKRADIWAFGVVLYEMVTGDKLFAGEDLTDTLASVVKIDPDLSLAPPELQRLLAKCLAKDPKKRLRDIGDVWELLGSGAGPRPAADSKAALLPWTATALAAVAAVAFAALWLWPRPAPLPEVTRFEITAPKGSRLPMGTPAPSPDGRTLAYTVTDPDGVTRIHLRRLDQTDSRALPGTDGAIHPFWSPDGRSLAFVTIPGRELKRIDVEAGAPRVLAENVVGPWHGDWGEKGDLLGMFAGISRVSAQGAAAAQPLGLNGAHPFFLPDGKRFLFVGGNDTEPSIQLGALDSKDATTVLQGVDSAPLLASTPRGKTYLLYLQGPDLAAREFDTGPGTVRGEPFVLIPNIGVVASPAVKPAVGVSRNGVLAYQQGTGASVDLTWFDRSGRSQGSLPADAAGPNPRLSPDGSMLSVVRDGDVWVTDLARASSTRVTFDARAVFHAVWAPDGKRLVFGGGGGVRTVSRDGSEEKSVTKDPGVPLSWSPDGQHFLMGPISGTAVLESLEQSGEPVPVGSRNGSTRNAVISPDGRFIAFESNESGRNEVYVQTMPPGTGQTKVSVNGGADPRWNANGRELFFVSPEGALMAADTQLGQTFSAGIPHELFRIPGGLIDYDVHPDGRRFLISRPAGGTNENPITVVLNWWADLDK